MVCMALYDSLTVCSDVILSIYYTIIKIITLPEEKKSYFIKKPDFYIFCLNNSQTNYEF